MYSYGLDVMPVMVLGFCASGSTAAIQTANIGLNFT